MTTAPESRIVLGFEGPEPPDWLVATDPEQRPGGLILGVHWNVEDADQVRRLTTSLQALAEPGLPFLICADEEGGQLAAFTGITTPFPGAMALGATGDTDLARRVAGASGEELAALGVNVVLAPVVDVVTRPDNPSLGIRGFGDDPATGGPDGGGDGRRLPGGRAWPPPPSTSPARARPWSTPTTTLPVLDLDDDRLDAVEFAPFRAAADAGVDLLMIGHYSVPVLTGDRVTPISASPALRDVVRRRVGFGGVVISDALDMGAFTASGTNAALVAAGVDALLCMTDRERAAAATLAIAGSDPNDHTAATGRLTALRRRLAARREPGLDRLRSPEHLAIAAEVAVRSLTLVRDGGTLPLSRGERILAVMPRPTDLTPADTSSFQVAGLAGALRGQAGSVSEVVVPIEPESTDIDAVLAAAGEHDAVVLGTIAADVHPGQAALARRLVAAVPRVITVALRTPFDLAAYPEATTHVCTYSLLEPSMTALAGALFGSGSFPGRLPAPIPGLYPTGHGLTGPRAAP